MSIPTAPMSTPVTTIFARTVRPGNEARYEEWLHGIHGASAEFPGFQGTTVLKPAPGREQYVAITQFASPEDMNHWLESDLRESWLERLGSICIESEQVVPLAGLERWVTLDAGAPKTPPRYKTAVVVFLGVYGTSSALGWVLGPLVVDWPAWAARLLVIGCTVPAMVWFVLPALSRLFARWLKG